MRNNEKVKKFFERIEVSSELEQKILLNTINKESEKKYKIRLLPKFLVAGAIIVLMLTTATVMASEHIKSYIFTKKNISDQRSMSLSVFGRVELKKNMDFACKENLTKIEVESALGINLLSNPKYETTSYFNHCDIKTTSNGKIRTVKLTNDGNIQRIKTKIEVINPSDFLSYDLIDDSNKYLEYEVSFMTNYATKEDEENFQNLYEVGGHEDGFDDLIDDYKIESLGGVDTKIILWLTGRRWSITFCYFVYNNVVYQLQGYGMNKSEMIEIIENLKY